jgi:hypothetical protein
MIVHKIGPQKAERYVGFGQYEQISSPLCEGSKGLWKGRSYRVARYWKHVTCKKCLRKGKKGTSK